MNMLAGVQDPNKEIFESSDKADPCTKGVNFSKTFLPLEEFSTLNGNYEIDSKKDKISIGFVDTEGQGGMFTVHKFHETMRITINLKF